MVEFVDLKKQYSTLKASIDKRIQGVLDHGQFIMGPEIRELEGRLEKYTGSPHCVTVSSGTEALLISLMACGIGPGDEVITTPFTFVATAEVIVLLGATPVFVDIDPNYMVLDASLIEAAITPKTKAIMPVSLYGQMADMDAIEAIAAKHGLVVIEDAAQSFGAVYRGRKSCNLSKIGCTSFFPSKPLGCYGDGGAIFLQDEALAQAAREIRVHGQSKRYYHTRIGVGGRLDTMQAAILLAKLDVFDSEIANRNKLAEWYGAELADVDGLLLPEVGHEQTSVWAQYTVRVSDRDGFIARLRQQGIPTAVHYPIPLHRQPAYAERVRVSGDLKQSEAAAQSVVSLPMHPYMDQATFEQIVDGVRAACADNQRNALVA